MEQEIHIGVVSNAVHRDTIAAQLTDTGDENKSIAVQTVVLGSQQGIEFTISGIGKDLPKAGLQGGWISGGITIADFVTDSHVVLLSKPQYYAALMPERGFVGNTIGSYVEIDVDIFHSWMHILSRILKLYDGVKVKRLRFIYCYTDDMIPFPTTKKKFFQEELD